ncbi:MAG: FecR domain-containing protein [Desulfobaccales bacterium]
MILASQVGSLTAAQGDMAGRLTMVEGQVDLLRGGQLPAIPVKVDDGVQSGDVLRTKSLSKAMVTFIDNSTLTISPESRVAIEEYMFNPAQEKRNAVIQLFQGLAYVVVHKVFKPADPDFVVKTHTAIMGIRGTEFGIRLSPNSSTIMDFEGVIQVANIFPEVAQVFRRAFKIAYAWGGNTQVGVLLQAMQGTTVDRGMTPTLPFAITPQDRQSFMNQLSIGLSSRLGTGNSNSVAASSTSGTGATNITDQGVSLMGLGANPTVILPLRVQTTAPPQIIAPPPPAPPPPPLGHSGMH